MICRFLMLVGLAGSAGCATTATHAKPGEARRQPTQAVGRIPSPLSAHKALRSVLDIVASPSTEDYVLVRGLRSDSRIGRDSAPDHVRVRLDLTILGTDDVEATARFVELVNELEASPWCTRVQRQSTAPLLDGGGIYTDDLEIDVQLATSSLDPVTGRSPLAPELYIRSVAAKDSIGALRIRPRTRQPMEGVTDTVTSLAPATPKQSFSQEHILAFLEDLDDETEGVFVTQVSLRNPGRNVLDEEPPQWFFEAQCTTRTPRLD